MITEDYVSFETAKLLKEKGFDGRCRDYYNTDGHFYSEDFKSDWNDGGLGTITIFSAPTLQMVIKWKRIVREIRFFRKSDREFIVGLTDDFDLENQEDVSETGIITK